MSAQGQWSLMGIFYECCRMEGLCPLAFGRDMRDEPCDNIATFQVNEGHIGEVDMKGMIMTFHQAGISPKFADLAWSKKGGIEEGAWYVNENATDKQREILQSFLPKQLGAQRWKRCLGVKFVKIDISEQNGIYHITMPHGEQKLQLTVGGDGNNPIYLGNPIGRQSLTDIKVCNGILWRWHDYGQDVEWRSTSGVIADFAYQGG